MPAVPMQLWRTVIEIIFPKLSTKKKEESSRVTPPWIDLPRDITAAILQKLEPFEIIVKAQNVCSTWRSVCRDISMWRRIDLRYPDNLSVPWYHLEQISWRAVDLSQGQLIEFSIRDFGTDDFLLYLSERCRYLRIIRLMFCKRITSKGLREAIKRMPLLEELHLYVVNIDRKAFEAIEAIGSSCPQLKLFTFGHMHRQKITCDMPAEAIGKSIPGLRHLKIMGAELTDLGMQAILDGCPHLETLDLTHCFKLSLQEKMVRLCLQRFKVLFLSNDYLRLVQLYSDPVLVAALLNCRGSWDFELFKPCYKRFW